MQEQLARGGRLKEGEGMGVDRDTDPKTDGLCRDTSRAALSWVRGLQEPIPEEEPSQTPLHSSLTCCVPC